MKNNYDKDRASINNINYINKVNDNKLQLITNSNEYSSNTSLGFAPVENKSSSLGRGTAVAQAILPFNLKSLKIDLFDNATHEQAMMDRRKFKVACNIITANGKRQVYRAGMNSAIRFYKRGVVDQNSTHYQLVKQLVEELKCDGVDGLRVSKFYRNNSNSKDFGQRHKSMQDMSCIMHQTPHGYYFYIVISDKIIPADVESGRGVTPAQQRAGCIATWYSSQGTATNYQPGYAIDDLLDD